MSEIKQQLRNRILTNRKQLSEDYLKRANSALMENIVDLVQLHGVECIHCFLPIARNNEPDMWPLIDRLLTEGLDIMTSLTNFKKQTMKHFWIEKNTFYVQGNMGIPEPRNCEEAFIEEVEMVLIPLLACDKQGNRIGYGKGYYDRLLAEMDQNVLKVGVNLTELFDLFPFSEPHDVNVDLCVTPKQIITCHEDGD